MFGLWRVRPFVPVLLCSERFEAGRVMRNLTAEETHRTALALVAAARGAGLDLAEEGFLVDPGLVPVASDAEGQLARVLDSIARIRRDPALAGARFCVGLSNLAVMLPTRCHDGTPVRSALESAFLTLAVPLGLDTAIASVRRKLEPLPEGHPALECLKDVVRLGGFDAILRVKEFYSGGSLR
jgi:cobalamin-dependent methionine synthase I